MIIPYLGSIVGITFPLIYSIIQTGSFDQALCILIGYAFIQIIEGNIITPRIMGDKIGINPFLIIITMLLLGTLWGIPGIIISIPLLAIIKTIVEVINTDPLIRAIFENH